MVAKCGTAIALCRRKAGRVVEVRRNKWKNKTGKPVQMEIMENNDDTAVSWPCL